MRVQNLNIGAAIYQFLANDTTVASLVGTRIYPLVAPEGTEFPYIVYSNVGMSTARDKDSFFYEQDVLEGVVICTDSYKNGVDIAMAVADAMQFGETDVTVDDETISIMESSFDSRTEDYVNNVFVQGLVFKLKIR